MIGKIAMAARRGAVLLVLLALGLAPAAAQSLSYGQGLLWSVDRDGVPTSHVFGTFHSTDPQILALDAPVLAAFNAAKSVALELILDDASRFALARAMVLPPNRALKDVIAPPLFAQVVTAVAAYGLDAAQVDRLKPWAVGLLFSVPPEEQARQAAGQLALDSWLQREAQARGKSVIGLETIEEQIAMFDELAPDLQRAFLAMATAEQESAGRTFENAKRAYLRRDLDALSGLSRQDLAGVDRRLRDVLEERILIERNRRMAQRMTGLLDRGGAFVGVGALHLPGEQGILALLAQHGYRVRRAD
jgi:uncharacterized protein